MGGHFNFFSLSQAEAIVVFCLVSAWLGPGFPLACVSLTGSFWPCRCPEFLPSVSPSPLALPIHSQALLQGNLFLWHSGHSRSVDHPLCCLPRSPGGSEIPGPLDRELPGEAQRQSLSLLAAADFQAYFDVAIAKLSSQRSGRP